MSQSSFSVPNEAGAAFRSDTNAAHQAVASQSSGSSAPGTTYAYQRWADTTNGVVKRRNAANSAWITDDPLAETFAVARSSNTILALADCGKTFIATSSFTQTLTAAATLGDGWTVLYRNDGAGVITLDPNGSETIDGSTTITLAAGEACAIVCDGSNFKTIGRKIAGSIPDFTSAETTVPTGATTTSIAHGLTTVPSLVQAVLRNKTAEQGYSIGDELLFVTGFNSQLNTVSDATNVVIVQAATPNIPNKTTGTGFTLTAANWKWVVRAWR
jgi:hypothetical protein